MRQKLQFLGFALFLCSLVTQVVAEQKTNSSQAPRSKPASATRKVDVSEFEKLWQNKSNTVLDVRSAKEFAAGHIPGALNLDVNAPGFEQKLRELKPEKTYLVHCAAGVRSARACDIMSRHGLTNLVDLAPGFRAWEKEGKPVEK
jgi:rhodanese-related sulfurtransferase